ncbi:MAG: hypothetical protein JSW06_01480 [Thermoplasmatales archaeon]|nr:MAG: hypothetical protein JSW06_01480 [Thermoplasmatales archaeon]
MVRAIKRLQSRKSSAIATIFITLLILLGTVTITVYASGTTIVNIDPSSQIVSPGNNFTINVSCAPGQPIKSFELKLSFNPSILQVNSVTEGNIFSGYNTYFNAGTINNTAGTIVDVYGLIVGSGNVTGNGTFVSIRFTAKSVSGTSTLGLYDVGITNETSYVPISVNNGSVQVDATPPEIVDNSPTSGTTGDSYTFNVSITDNIDTAGELTVKVDWSHGSLGGNDSMINVGGNYFEKTVTLDQNSISSMTYVIYANDTYGNTNTTTQASATVTDNDDPSLVADNSDAGGTTGDSFGFDFTVSDNIGVGGVNVSWSHGSLGGNLALGDDGDGTWSGSVMLDDNLGNLVYRVQVNDTSGNYVRGSQQSKSVTDNDNPEINNVSATPSIQNIGGYVNITALVNDNVAIGSVYLNITFPDSSIQNFSITGNKSGNTYYCNKTYSMIGTHTYFILADDTSGNSDISTADTFLIGEQTSPQISNVVNTPSDPLDTYSSFGWINITCDVTDNIGVDEVFLNITNPDGSYNNVSMNAGTSNSYFLNSSSAFSLYGNYSYFIWANDTSGNVGVSNSYDFSMPPNWDVDMNGECKVFDMTLLSNHYEETGDAGWIREDVDNNGKVEILDFVFVSNHYNESWWS